MTYQECLDYLYNQLPMFQRVGSSAYIKSQDNIVALSDAIGNPHRQFPTIHIAGTNGKGSSSNMLAAILQSAGYKTGLYTSPHLKEFTERIKINGQDITREYLVQFVEEYNHLFDAIKPSFFEMTVALAFKYFADAGIDIAVVEVGLGGRLDSTNIITPLVSLITNISLDHQLILGDDVVSIAGEKAGIIKEGVPAVISKTQAEVAPVFIEKAKSCNAPLYFADQELKIEINKSTVDRQFLNVVGKGNINIKDVELSLAGSYQQYNLPGVLKVIALLQESGFNIPESAIRTGLSQVNELTGFKGRWQIISRTPLTICDTGHNEDGIKQILKQLSSLNAPTIHMVLGLVKDKDITEIIKLLPPAYNYYFCQAKLPRALPADELAELAKKFEIKGAPYADVNEAHRAARNAAKPDDVIFIGGSTFVVAEIEEL